jgi:hypothetical protein
MENETVNFSKGKSDDRQTSFPPNKWALFAQEKTEAEIRPPLDSR